MLHFNFEQRLNTFISQIKSSVLSDTQGVYIVLVSDVVCEGNFKNDFTESTIRYIKEADIQAEIHIAETYSMESTVTHLKTRDNRTHTIILSYCCNDLLGNEIFSMSGPI
jgi:hypothetical protein